MVVRLPAMLQSRAGWISALAATSVGRNQLAVAVCSSFFVLSSVSDRSLRPGARETWPTCPCCGNSLGVSRRCGNSWAVYRTADNQANREKNGDAPWRTVVPCPLSHSSRFPVSIIMEAVHLWAVSRD